MSDEKDIEETPIRANQLDTRTSEPFLDEKVRSEIATLQPDFRVHDIEGHGASRWSRTARVITVLGNGTKVSYFLKISSADCAEQMMRGEFESQKALYKYVPDFIPKPINFGQYVSDPRTFFYLCEFIEMTEEVPRPRDFCTLLADLHNGSMGDSNKFGFPSTRVQGSIRLDIHVEDKWTDFFKKAMRHMIEQEAETHGRSNEIDDLAPALIDKVIPRLLSPLETGDQCITPCLVHGDLWDGNASVSVETGAPYVFDSCALWAHNEYDLAFWRAIRYKFGRSYVNEYQKHVAISTPVEDWDDRNALYAIRVDLLCSALSKSSQQFRELAVAAMKQLVEKYPEGYEGNNGP